MHTRSSGAGCLGTWNTKGDPRVATHSRAWMYGLRRAQACHAWQSNEITPVPLPWCRCGSGGS